MYASSNIIWVFKSRRMRWVGAYSTYGAERCIRGLVGKAEGRNHVEDPGIDGIYKKFEVEGWGLQALD